MQLATKVLEEHRAILKLAQVKSKTWLPEARAGAMPAKGGFMAILLYNISRSKHKNKKTA